MIKKGCNTNNVAIQQVDTLVGTSYDTIKAVYDELENIKLVAENLNLQRGPQGNPPDIVTNPDGSYTITGNNGQSVTVTNGTDGVTPTVTSTATEVTISDGTNTVTFDKGYVPVKGVDYSDGDTIFRKYQYSPNGTTVWSDTLNDTHNFQRFTTVTNGVEGTWSNAFSLTGSQGVKGNAGDKVYLEREYSVDAVDFHSEFQDTDYYVRSRTVTEDHTGAVTNSAWSNPARIKRDGVAPVKGTDYFDGNDGSYISFIFISSELIPADPIGGNYTGSSENIPSGWSDDAPVKQAGHHIWQSKRRYTHDGTSWTGTAWSTPRLFSGADGATPTKGIDYFDGDDGSYLSFIFHTSETKPALPVGGAFTGISESIPNGWTDDPTQPNINEFVWVSKTRYTEQAGNWVGAGWSDPTKHSGDNGYTPIKGTDYFDGKEGRFTSFVYRNSNTKPSLPIGGSFNGTVETQPQGWTDDPQQPQGDNKTWVSVTVYELQDNGTWIKTGWADPSQFSGDDGYTPVKGIDYFDGNQGRGYYVSLVYRNSASKPTIPGDGSFDGATEVYPSGWTDDPQDTFFGEYTWMVSTSYREDAQGNWVRDSWTNPVRMTGIEGKAPVKGVDYFDGTNGADGSDGKFVSHVFSNGINRPSIPSGGTYNGTTEVAPTDWNDNPETPLAGSYVWISTTTYTKVAGTWENSGWSVPSKFSGEAGYTPVKGVDYFDGVAGEFTSFIFRNARLQPTKPVGGAYNGTDEVIPTTWTDDPEQPVDTETTWVSKCKYKIVNGNWVNTSGWSEPSRFSGLKGDGGTAGGYTRTLYHRGGSTYQGDPETNPNDWTTTPPLGSRGILWAASAQFNGLDERQTDWVVFRMEADETNLRELIRAEEQARLDLAEETFKNLNDYAVFREDYEQRMLTGEVLTDAIVEIDPANGLITNKAFQYTDNKFTEASVIIDGVNSRVDIQAENLTVTNNTLARAESQLAVMAGQINLRATYSEVTEQISGAIDALTPAYSWQFNSNDEGFVGQQSWNNEGYLILVAGADARKDNISYVADDNPAIRMRVRKHTNAQWTGTIRYDNGFVSVPEPAQAGAWEIINVDLTGAVGYTGTKTFIEVLLGNCDLDYLTIGKQGANDVELSDVTSRTTQLEFDMDAGTGRMAQYATIVELDSRGYQNESGVLSVIDASQTISTIQATLLNFDNNDTLIKANTAATWVDGASANIRNEVIAYNTEEGIPNGTQFTKVTSDLDALTGTVQDEIYAVRELYRKDTANGLADVIESYNEFIQSQRLEQDEANFDNFYQQYLETRTQFAIANQSLQAVTTDTESLAQQSTELLAGLGDALSRVENVSQALSTESEARATSEANFNTRFQDTAADIQTNVQSIANAELATTNLSNTLTTRIGNAESTTSQLAQTVTDNQNTQATVNQNLTSAITDGDTTTLAAAQDYTRTAVGYCVNSNGDPVSQFDGNAAACITAGHSWITGNALAESVRRVGITTDTGTATVNQLMQTYEDSTGSLNARANFEVDVNGRVSGVRVNGSATTSEVALVGDTISFVDPTTFSKQVYWDNTAGTMVIKGKLVLSDGHEVNNLVDIRAQDGADGANGSDGVNGTDGQDGADGANGADGADGAPGDKGDKGDTGDPGAPGATGPGGPQGERGAGTYFAQVSNNTTTYNVYSAIAAVQAVDPAGVRIGDTVTLWSNNASGQPHWSEQRTYSGGSTTSLSNWDVARLAVDGNVVVSGSITSEKLAANIIIGNSARFYGRLEAASGTFTGTLSGASGTFSGNITGGTINIGTGLSVNSNGITTIRNGVFTGINDFSDINVDRLIVENGMNVLPQAFFDTGVTINNSGSFRLRDYGDVKEVRVNSRSDGSSHTRAHWYNNTSTGAATGARHAWYDGNSYINMDFFSDTMVIGGHIQASGNYTMNAKAFNVTSDKTLKKDINVITDPMDKIHKLSGYTYSFKSDNSKSVGIMAQELQKVFPQAVRKSVDGNLTVDGMAVTATLIECVKEMDSKLKVKEDEIAALTKRLEAIESLLSKQ